MIDRNALLHPADRPRKRIGRGAPVDYIVIAECPSCGTTSRRNWWERRVRCPEKNCRRIMNILKKPRDHIWT